MHRFTDRAGFYIRGLSNGKALVLGLTTEGEQYMTETLGLRDGAKFAGDTLRWLYKRKWAVPLDNPPPELPVEVAAPSTAARDSNQGVVQLRLASSDHVALDQCAEEIVQTLGGTGAGVLGPIPLPVHLETYTVIRETTRQTYEIRLYQRLLQVRNPGRATLEAMTGFRLPREVDLAVEALS